MSYTDLGKAVGLSTSAVHQRVRRLEERGVVRGYTASVDHEALGMPLTAFVAITPFDQSAPDETSPTGCTPCPRWRRAIRSPATRTIC